MLTNNAIWNNFNSANAFDTDDTSTFFHMKNNVQVSGWFLKSDFGGSGITFENNIAINGGELQLFAYAQRRSTLLHSHLQDGVRVSLAPRGGMGDGGL